MLISNPGKRIWKKKLSRAIYCSCFKCFLVPKHLIQMNRLPHPLPILRSVNDHLVWARRSWNRETSKTCRLVVLEDQDWETQVHLPPHSALQLTFAFKLQFCFHLLFGEAFTFCFMRFRHEKCFGVRMMKTLCLDLERVLLAEIKCFRNENTPRYCETLRFSPSWIINEWAANSLSELRP